MGRRRETLGRTRGAYSLRRRRPEICTTVRTDSGLFENLSLPVHISSIEAERSHEIPDVLGERLTSLVGLDCRVEREIEVPAAETRHDFETLFAVGIYRSLIERLTTGDKAGPRDHVGKCCMVSHYSID